MTDKMMEGAGKKERGDIGANWSKKSEAQFFEVLLSFTWKMCENKKNWRQKMYDTG